MFNIIDFITFYLSSIYTYTRFPIAAIIPNSTSLNPAENCSMLEEKSVGIPEVRAAAATINERDFAILPLNLPLSISSLIVIHTPPERITLASPAHSSPID